MINVSNIERFATHDGPGIRTTVFLKGCAMRCPWCANPETWDVESTLMYNRQKCVGCHHCQESCPQEAIRFQPDFHWDPQQCIRCQVCVKQCLNDALSMNGQWMDEQDVIAEVMKDWDYYQASQGGVTFSGGEPFFQWEGFLTLLERAKKQGLHVAVETTGNVPPSRWEQAMDLIDLFLFDIKHTDRQRLQEVTKSNPDWVMTNFRSVCQKRSQDVIVRMPVIPDFNQNQIEAVIQLAKEYQVREVNLLPFHSMAKNKWMQLDREYAYREQPMMDPESLKEYESSFVRIGG